MAVEKIYSGDDSDTTFDITFPFLASTDVQASVNDVTKTAGTDYTISGTVLTFTTAPPTGTNNVKIFRVTDISSPQATFTAGSSVKATDLNNVVKQMLYAIEEVGTVTASNTGLGLVAGSKGDIHVNSATDWYINTALTAPRNHAIYYYDADPSSATYETAKEHYDEWIEQGYDNVILEKIEEK